MTDDIGRTLARRRKSPRIIGAIVGVIVAYALCHERLWSGISWYWNVGCWIEVGGVAGISVGQWFEQHIPRFRSSDGPAVIGGVLGMATLAVAWAAMPHGFAAIVGSVGRALLGAYLGFMAVEVMTYKTYASARYTTDWIANVVRQVAQDKTELVRHG